MANVQGSPRARAADLKRDLAREADPHRARGSASFFKTAKGEYGEGDRFIGVAVPAQRKIALRYLQLPLDEIAKLLASRVHEHRTTALAVLVAQYQSGDAAVRKSIFDFYLTNLRSVNNWDLVDGSAPYIIGGHLRSRRRARLYKLAKSRNVWERRIAMVATLPLIRAGDLDDAFAIAALLLGDKHDLIHKAVGWMLREAGKQSPAVLLAFLERNYAAMPRTALRYAIERFPPAQRKRILAGAFD